MNLSKDVEKIFDVLKERQQKILARRFGLFDYKKATLARIGSDMNLTRERIRQIESSALKELDREENIKKISSSVNSIKKVIRELGGVIVIEQIADSIFRKSQRSKQETNALELILSILPDLKISKKNQNFRKYWYSKEYNKKIIDKIAREYRQILKEVKKPIKPDELIKQFSKTSLGKKTKLNQNALNQVIYIDKTIGINQNGKVGLMNWPAINPKSARDKAYLILREAGKPLHYREIAKRIKEENFYASHNPTAATVHNEVILDDRFVLIGRGIYALKEWGYQPGTVEDVIISILERRPKGMKKGDIVEKVLDQRKVAKNTVLANLNRREIFKKQDNQVYRLAKSK
jgi:hypothetical protein